MTSYKGMEEVLKKIHQNYITMNDDEVKFNNEFLRTTLERLKDIMKNQDALFKAVYETTFYGGSFYDGVKVGKPDEYDLHLLLVVPKACGTHKVKNCGCVKLTVSNKPGYLWFNMKQNYYDPFNKFIKDGYMQTNLVLNWLKGLIISAMNNLQDPNVRSFSCNASFHSESGPALTLRLNGKFGHVDVDVVPAFKFGSNHWPKQPYRSNPSKAKTDFFIVPKKVKELDHGERYWRASFQAQERELIEGKERLKPALRLLKKTRDSLDHTSISSYALKNMLLWELEAGLFDKSTTLSDTFMKLLEKYKESLGKQTIPYYWNKRENLLDKVGANTLTNHHNELVRKMRDIQNNYIESPLMIAKIILKEGSEEYNSFMKQQKK